MRRIVNNDILLCKKQIGDIILYKKYIAEVLQWESNTAKPPAWPFKDDINIYDENRKYYGVFGQPTATLCEPNISLSHTTISQFKVSDYFNLLEDHRDDILKEIGTKMGNSIKPKLDEYLEFDSKLLFNSPNNLVRVFGGAIRDSIANKTINDVDILCGSKSINYINDVLSSNGYKFNEHLTPKDLSAMYSDIHVISEPHSWLKGDKIVQIIRPSMPSFPVENTEKEYIDNFKRLICNVDISCCGVSYDGYELYENIENAILHCLSNKFYVNESSLMYSIKRIFQRVDKLKKRGWVQIIDSMSENRDLKIKYFLGETDNILNFNYIKEYEIDGKFQV